MRHWNGLPAPGNPEVRSDIRRLRRALFAPDGRHLLACGHQSLTVRNLVDGTVRTVELWDALGGQGDTFAITAGGSHFVVAQTHARQPQGWITCRQIGNPTPEGAVWSCTTPHRICRGPVILPGNRFLVTEVRLLLGTRRGAFMNVVRSVTTGEVLAESAGRVFGVEKRYISSGGGRFFAGFNHAWIWVYSTDAFADPLVVLRNDSRRHFTDAAFHPSGRFLAATSNDQTVKFYDTTTWGVARTFTWDIGKMRSIAFSPDGNLAAAGSDTGKVVVWDVDL